MIENVESSRLVLYQQDRATIISTLPQELRSTSSDEALQPYAQAGFTLLELMVVVVILGLLIGLVAPAVLRQLGGARDALARQSIERIAVVLDLYKLDVGSYPSSDQGLAALNTLPSGITNWNGPYLKGEATPVDPWSHPYVYRNPSNRADHDYDLCSVGANGKSNETISETIICNK